MPHTSPHFLGVKVKKLLVTNILLIDAKTHYYFIVNVG